MTLQGYTTNIDSSDPTAHIEINPDGITADFIVDEGSGNHTVTLNFNEVCDLLIQVNKIKAEMWWNHATNIMATQKYAPYNKPHIIPKTKALREEYLKQIAPTLGAEINETTLCGLKSPRPLGWILTPIIGQPDEGCCKRCLTIWRNSLNFKELQPVEDTLGDIK